MACGLRQGHDEGPKPKSVGLKKLFFKLQVLLKLSDLFKTAFILHAPWRLVKLLLLKFLSYK